MNIDLIFDIVYLVIFAICVIVGDVVKSWWSFFFGAIVALAARNVGSELMRRFGRQHQRRVR